MGTTDTGELRPPTARPPRVATSADAPLVTRILVAAFAEDPIWGDTALTDADRGRQWREAAFRLLVDAAIPQSWVWLAADDSAVALWTPPGGTGLSAAGENEFDRLLTASLEPSAADRLRITFESIDQAHPSEPHFYLSLLGVDPSRSGGGHAQRLLAENLRSIDGENFPAYLECVDGLVRVYRRFGFEVMARLDLPVGGRTNLMWRHPQRR